MQEDFHYYATYAAAYLAGYNHEESLTIAYSAQFVDCCTATLLKAIKAPVSAATTQLTLELADARTDIIGLQDITRIWASFHFLPYDLNRKLRWRNRLYKNKYRLICDTNSELVEETVRRAEGKSLQAVGLAMHVMADTWAHRYFAGTPSMVINAASAFYDLDENKPIKFNHNPATKDDVEKGHYTSTMLQNDENTIMNLGHGMAGHLPDYSFMHYQFMPSWGEYEIIKKDNPSDYYHAFCQMVYAMECLRDGKERFEKDVYAWDRVAQYKDEIMAILSKRQLSGCADWKAFDEKLSGESIEDFDVTRYENEYKAAVKNDKEKTFLGKFILAALAQKSLVTSKIHKSGNLLAGYSVDYNKRGFKGIKDFRELVKQAEDSHKTVGGM